MNSPAGVGRQLAWPRPLAQLAAFLRQELAAFPGRGNVMLRCVLGSAIVIVASMTLQVPELPVSLIAVFFVTQANVVLTRLVGVMLMVGTTLAVACTIGVYTLTFDYPLLRIVVASAIFFCCTYLMRAVTKLGLVFFLMALVVIYAQTFADLTDNAEALVRSVLWVWSAVSYPVAVALVVNTLLLPAEPERQLRSAMQRQLATVDARLDAVTGAQARSVRIGPPDLQRNALSLQKLLRFATMRRRYGAQDASAMLACVTAVSRVVEAAASLPDDALARDAGQIAAIRAVQGDLGSLGRAIGDDAQWPRWTASTSAPVSTAIAEVDAMQRALGALLDATAAAAPSSQSDARAPRAAGAETAAPKPAAPGTLLEPDAFANPRYARFALRTLLSVLICYVFYNAVNWPGIHTVMLTSLIVALPSLGASRRHGLLRICGALIGSGLALFMVVFVIPHLESVPGLLLMSLPVIALGAWVSAGSERIGYAGIQIMFTFALALLESFSPPSGLTEIRDRMVGILLGVGVATFVQMSVWPEGEADALRGQLASVLREIAALARANAQALSAGARASAALPLASATWAKLADCDAVLARVALEPDWREGEPERVTLLSQTVLAQSRALLVAIEAFHDESMADALEGAPADRTSPFQSNVADVLERYATQLAAQPPEARTPAVVDAAGWLAACAGEEGAARAAALSREVRRINSALIGLPRWTSGSEVPDAPAATR
ncbi:FUSC family protein [Paraburkholderia ferrariae]|uniref:FUSC family protein n=1 Tax=Paraburkholderia ferrariae TaxID=386056 RepID=UPI0006940EAF|nr:FUSC family protein [Paraburkholderia ferrariae]